MVNRRGSAWVERAWRVRVHVTGIALIVAALATAGLSCVEIDGGAVELSWSVRTPDGCQASCDLRGKTDQCNNEPGVEFDFADLDEVRICWQAVGDGGPPELRCARDPDVVDHSTFRCNEVHGVTGFEIAPGPTAIWIEPLCEGTGLVPPADRYEVPAPIVREITSGRVATLNALLIVADPEACEP